MKRFVRRFGEQLGPWKIILLATLTLASAFSSYLSGFFLFLDDGMFPLFGATIKSISFYKMPLEITIVILMVQWAYSRLRALLKVIRPVACGSSKAHRIFHLRIGEIDRYLRQKREPIVLIAILFGFVLFHFGLVYGAVLVVGIVFTVIANLAIHFTIGFRLASLSAENLKKTSPHRSVGSVVSAGIASVSAVAFLAGFLDFQTLLSEQVEVSGSLTFCGALIANQDSNLLLFETGSKKDFLFLFRTGKTVYVPSAAFLSVSPADSDCSNDKL